MPSGIGPNLCRYAHLCALQLLPFAQNEPYPLAVMAPIQSQHPDMGSGMCLAMKRSRSAIRLVSEWGEGGAHFIPFKFMLAFGVHVVFYCLDQRPHVPKLLRRNTSTGVDAGDDAGGVGACVSFMSPTPFKVIKQCPASRSLLRINPFPHDPAASEFASVRRCRPCGS